MSGKRVGYIRVSTAGQNTDRQLEDIELDKVFEEKASGRSANDRAVLATCLDFCREDDHLFVHSIDRLARNLRDLENTVELLLAKGTSVTFVKDDLKFTPSSSTATSKLMRQMLGAFAEFEHTLISNRRSEGVEAARRRGKQIGRKKTLTDDQVREIRLKLSQGAQKKSLAQEYGISRTTLYAALAAFQEET